MTAVNPSYQQVNPPKLQELLDAFRNEVKKDINCARVGVIQAFDPATQTATVKIAQQQVTSIAQDGTRTIQEYPILLQVPVYYPSGGGATLTFPIAEGNECLVVFNDRELDNWFISGPGQAPTTGRIHDLSDGIAYVGVRSGPHVLEDVSVTSTQLRSDDGDTIIDLNPASKIITITAPGGMIFNTPLLAVTGDVTAGTISQQNHVHDGVQPGGGDTGAPIP